MVDEAEKIEGVIYVLMQLSQDGPKTWELNEFVDIYACSSHAARSDGSEK